MRKPWFEIISVSEGGRLSLADIAKAISDETQVPLELLRGPRQTRRCREARKRFYVEAFAKRPDLSSEQIGRYIHRTGSCIRRMVKRSNAA